MVTGRVAAMNGGGIRISVDSQEGADAEEFVLAAPLRGVFPGDEVRVDYRTDDQGHKVALRVIELSSRQ